jgi:hypothetical protein
MRRHHEQGSALVVVMIVVAALLAGAAILTSMQTKSSHGSQINQHKISGLYCAEAGLNEAKATIISSHASWDADLGTGVEPSWLGGIQHDIDGDGANDFTITLRDNDDEDPNDLAHDTDHAVFVVSTCIKYPESPTTVTVLLKDTGERKLWLRTE